MHPTLRNPAQEGKGLFIQLPKGKSSWGDASPSQNEWFGRGRTLRLYSGCHVGEAGFIPEVNRQLEKYL